MDKGLDDPGVVGPEQGERPIARGEWACKEDLSKLVQTLEMGEVFGQEVVELRRVTLRGDGVDPTAA
jgi:hypothetical protein